MMTSVSSARSGFLKPIPHPASRFAPDDVALEKMYRGFMAEVLTLRMCIQIRLAVILVLHRNREIS